MKMKAKPHENHVSVTECSVNISFIVNHLLHILQEDAEAYTTRFQTPKMALFAKTVNDF